jgi:flagellar protein FliS
MSDQPAFSYMQTAAQGASPIGQVILLYDTILRDFSRAMAAQAAGDIEGRVSQLNHALTVIAHLQSVLDFDQGGEAAKRFERFYKVTRELIMQANAKATREPIEELIALYSKVRQAWSQADRNLAVGDPNLPSPAQRVSTSPIHSVGRDTVDDDTPRRRWST